MMVMEPTEEMIVLPGADWTFGWQEAVGGFVMISIAFLVTWVVTDLAPVAAPSSRSSR
jgi:hypothetical protein